MIDFVTNKNIVIRTGVSPGNSVTVTGTVRIVPTEDLKMHIGSKQRVVHRVPIEH